MQFNRFLSAMPQLDILLFSSQYVTGLLFCLGFFYFSKTVLPYISFFVKLEEYNILNSLEISDEILDDKQHLLVLRSTNRKVVQSIASRINFFKKKTFGTYIFL